MPDEPPALGPAVALAIGSADAMTSLVCRRVNASLAVISSEPDAAPDADLSIDREAIAIGAVDL